MQAKNNKKKKKTISLLEYFQSTHIPQAVFARKINITKTALFRIVKGLSTPTLKTAWEIEKATDGQVTLYSWIDELNEDKS